LTYASADRWKIGRPFNFAKKKKCQSGGQMFAHFAFEVRFVSPRNVREPVQQTRDVGKNR